MSKRKILIQLDADRHASVFDRVVAIDAGADEVFSYGGVEVEEVEGLVHGAIFTRKPSDLVSTAIFVGGKNVTRGEELLHQVTKTFFGPLRCSVMLDANGANTTAAAAVLAAARHLSLKRCSALVLGGTGPVGSRVALLLAQQQSAVWLASRTKDRAADACAAIVEKIPDGHVYPIAMPAADELRAELSRFDLVVCAGAAGVRVVPQSAWQGHPNLKVMIDLNAVPPTGIEGVDPPDSGRETHGVVVYGAIGVGGTKMKIHKAAVARLFEANDLVLDAEEIFAIGQRLESST